MVLAPWSHLCTNSPSSFIIVKGKCKIIDGIIGNETLEMTKNNCSIIKAHCIYSFVSRETGQRAAGRENSSLGCVVGEATESVPWGFWCLLNVLPLLFLFLNTRLACSWPHLPCMILHYVQILDTTFFPPIYRAQFGSEFGKFEPEQIRMG